MRNSLKLDHLTAHLLRLGEQMAVVHEKSLTKVCKIIVKDAKARIGHYQDPIGPFPGWQPLADATKADRVAKGYKADQPLLREGTLRDSIRFIIEGPASAKVFSSLDIAAFQEYGTATIPPRPFIGPAALNKQDAINEAFGEGTVNVIMSARS